jgi:hypothetical protein
MILIVDLNSSKRKKKKKGWKDIQTDGRTDGHTNRKIRKIFLRRWDKSCIYKGGTNVVF